jgi:hypothetical protein
MENAPVLLLSGTQISPAADPVLSARYRGWSEESYIPLRLSLPGSRGANKYEIIHPRPEYPSSLTTFHLENIELVGKSLQHPDRVALLTDMRTWIDRRVQQNFWGYYSELIKGFRNEAGRVIPSTETMVEGAPFLHLEGYRFRQEDRNRYEKWLDDYGFSVLIPLIVKLPGLRAYNCYKDTGISPSGIVGAKEWEYPDYISVLYFENQPAFDDYTKSDELFAFQKAIVNVFPNGLNYKWYVQYQHVRSWRK